MKKEHFKIVGLTGGIGSGKSTVSRYLKSKGRTVIDADKIAHEIVMPGSPILKELADSFGCGILNEDGTLNRKKLAGIAFADSTLSARMNEIMHSEIIKRIGEEIDKLAESGYSGMVFLDVPLLFETGMYKTERIDEIWVIDADEETRIKRVMSRDGIPRCDILNIMSRQMNSEEKRKQANVILENSGSEEELYQQLDKLIER